MKLSKELQTGKAAEHFVCFDLILQGYNAFLADQGLPYDILIDLDTRILRCQVRATGSEIKQRDHRLPVYRVGLRRGKTYHRRKVSEFDILAVVIIPLRKVAYINVKELESKQTGDVVTLIELKTKSAEYTGRTYSNGTVRKPYGRFIENYENFRKAL